MAKVNSKFAILLITVSAGHFCVGAQAAQVPVIDLNQPNDVSISSTSTFNPSASRQSLPMDERVRLLEQQLNNLTQMNLPAKIDALQQQLQELNGQLEVQTHTIQTLTDQQRTFYQDLNQRLNDTKLNKSASGEAFLGKTKATVLATAKPAKAELIVNSSSNEATVETVSENDTINPIDQAQASVVQNIALPKKPESITEKSEIAVDQNVMGLKKEAVISEEVATKSGVVTPSEEKAYQAAFTLLVNQQNDEAIATFNKFLSTYPQGSQAANAHYWLGELYAAQAKNDLAAEQFNAVVQQYRQHTKVPDAMLKLAIIHEDAGQREQARQELQKIVQQFPNSTAARLANMRLQQMKSSNLNIE